MVRVRSTGEREECMFVTYSNFGIKSSLPHLAHWCGEKGESAPWV